ncbi:uncharacterized protein LOC125830954 [Solanum verrucosum]|uniref:uncharacterized protein LOC125830954 n=1 Tax=Solanum verrucosum TaxID=315347 RepID=UPI0020D1E511|nr:uncharacterized protein LOC125830954 [Solanum verrucosum]
MVEHQLFAKKSKCFFGVHRIEYLGHFITAEGVSTDPQKIKVEALTQSHVLALPDANKTFIVEIDANGYGIFVVIMQEGHHISFISKSLSPRHVALLVYDRELLAIVQLLWLTKLMSFDYSTEYKKGVENKVVDALSRVTGVDLLALVISPTNTDLFQDVVDSWHSDPELTQLIADLQANHDSYKQFTWLQGQLRRKGKLAIGKKNMRTEVKGFIQRCDACQKNKSNVAAYPGLLQPLPLLEVVWSQISIDFIYGLPKSHSCKVFLDTIVKLYGLPDAITSDRDVVFPSSFWQELFTLQGVLLHISTTYHPQSDGQTEVLNRFLETYLRCYCSDDASNSIQTTPYEALYGKTPPLYLPYLPGELASAEIIKKVDHVAYTLLLPSSVKIHPAVHASLLKKCYEVPSHVSYPPIVDLANKNFPTPESVLK